MRTGVNNRTYLPPRGRSLMPASPCTCSKGRQPVDPAVTGGYAYRRTRRSVDYPPEFSTNRAVSAMCTNSAVWVVRPGTTLTATATR